jgi:metal-responsive CopG/Arc/MetJ family transcriptional regulator
MKTAISIPDDLFMIAEKTAKNMGIPRSQLFALALEEFIDSRRKNLVTEKINKVYKAKTEKSQSRIDKVSTELLRENLKNDSW